MSSNFSWNGDQARHRRGTSASHHLPFDIDLDLDQDPDQDERLDTERQPSKSSHAATAAVATVTATTTATTRGMEESQSTLKPQTPSSSPSAPNEGSSSALSADESSSSVGDNLTLAEPGSRSGNDTLSHEFPSPFPFPFPFRFAYTPSPPSTNADVNANPHPSTPHSAQSPLLVDHDRGQSRSRSQSGSCPISESHSPSDFQSAADGQKNKNRERAFSNFSNFSTLSNMSGLTYSSSSSPSSSSPDHNPHPGPHPHSYDSSSEGEGGWGGWVFGSPDGSGIGSRERSMSLLLGTPGTPEILGGGFGMLGDGIRLGADGGGGGSSNGLAGGLGSGVVRVSGGEQELSKGKGKGKARVLNYDDSEHHPAALENREESDNFIDAHGVVLSPDEYPVSRTGEDPFEAEIVNLTTEAQARREAGSRSISRSQTPQPRGKAYPAIRGADGGGEAPALPSLSVGTPLGIGAPIPNPLESASLFSSHPPNPNPDPNPTPITTTTSASTPSWLTRSANRSRSNSTMSVTLSMLSRAGDSNGGGGGGGGGGAGSSASSMHDKVSGMRKGMIRRGSKIKEKLRRKGSVGSGLGLEMTGAQGIERGTGGTPDADPTLPDVEPIVAREKGKGKAKGMMKKLMVRSKSSISVPQPGSPVGEDGGGSAARGTAVGMIVSPRRGGSMLLPLTTADVGGSMRMERELRPDGRKRAFSADTLKMYDAERALTHGVEGLPISSPSPETTTPASETILTTTAASIEIDSDSTPVIDQSYFDTKLPHELKIMVLRSLVDVHVWQLEKALRRGTFVGSRAAARWVGEPAGRRELIRLTRVSRSWRELALDGQLWANCDLHPFLGHMSSSCAATIIYKTSTFVDTLNLYGWKHLPVNTLTSAFLHAGAEAETRLTQLNIQGCRAMRPDQLMMLIKHSPRLKQIRAKASPAITQITVEAIGHYCPYIEVIDVSHCKRIAPLWCDTFKSDNWRSMKQLYIGGCAAEGVLAGIGRNMPNLEVLDISYSEDVTDDDIEELVSLTPEDYLPAFRRREERRFSRSDFIDWDVGFLTTLRAGQSAAKYSGCNGLVPRRITRLRKVVLSECRQLTDDACKYLAYAVPELEIFEMTSSGPQLADAGVISLLSSCLKLKKLDLEGASEITDEVLEVITPPAQADREAGRRYVGEELHTLNLGFASALTTQGLSKLGKWHMSRLQHVTLDNTAVNDAMVKEFIRRRVRKSWMPPGYLPTSSLCVIDCRNVSRNTVESLEASTRPRLGWRGWQAQPLEYQQGPKSKGLKDEIAEVPVLQSFWTWSKVPKAGRPSSHRRKDSEAPFTSEEIAAALGRSYPGDDRGCTIM